jgi:hypothetical protein
MVINLIDNNMPKENTKDVLEKFDDEFTKDDFVVDNNYYLLLRKDIKTFIKSHLASLQAQHEKEIKDIVNKEIEYWKNIFDNKPKDRNLESDNIAQNFARIEIEKWERRLIETDRWKKKVVRDGVEVYETSF